jgi:uncharacterized SAM-binding protein YcdF (DUF218 family)
VLVVQSTPGTEPGLVEDPVGTSVGDPSFSVVHLATPDSTREESRHFAGLAESRSWRTVVLVTSRYHLARAELLLRRCYKGDVMSVGVEAGVHRATAAYARSVLHEVGGLAFALTLSRGC